MNIVNIEICSVVYIKEIDKQCSSEDRLSFGSRSLFHKKLCVTDILVNVNVLLPSLSVL